MKTVKYCLKEDVESCKRSRVGRVCLHPFRCAFKAASPPDFDKPLISKYIVRFKYRIYQPLN